MITILVGIDICTAISS